MYQFFFISIVFTSDKQCRKLLYFSLPTFMNIQLEPLFGAIVALSWNKLTKMNDNNTWV